MSPNFPDVYATAKNSIRGNELTHFDTNLLINHSFFVSFADEVFNHISRTIL